MLVSLLPGMYFTCGRFQIVASSDLDAVAIVNGHSLARDGLGVPHCCSLVPPPPQTPVRECVRSVQQTENGPGDSQRRFALQRFTEKSVPRLATGREGMKRHFSL